jgi:tetratricopeptide (TPR) repeat protein
MPNGSSAVVPDVPEGEAGYRVPLPASDTDPVRSPEDAGGERSAALNSSSRESSSNFADLDKLMPRDDEDTNRKGKKGKEAPEYHETAGNDIDVGNYELERRNWKAALSRFQSAMIMDPENPGVFWGMAEAARHLGDFALARGYYQKVVDYDPDSRHGKDARKALKDPEIANGQSAAKTQAAPPQK